VNEKWRLKVVKRSLVIVVVGTVFSSKLLFVTALKTLDQTVESRNSDLLLTQTSLENHPDIPQYVFFLTTY